MVESGKTTLSSQFVQLPDTPTNFHRLKHVQKHQTRQSTEPLPPTPPKRANPVRFQQSRIYDNHVSLLILSTKLHPDSSTISAFQDFRFPPPNPPNVNRSGRDLK